MRRGRRTWRTAAWLAFVSATLAASLAQAGDLEAAAKAYRELHYDEARARLEAAAQAGGLQRADYVELLALTGDVSAVLDGPAVAERVFRKLLVVDPGHAPPRSDSPVFRVPFERARHWVADNGALKIAQAPPAAASATGATELGLRIASDPLAMVAGFRVLYAAGEARAFKPAGAPSLRPSLPPLSDGGTVRYYVEALDKAGDVIAELGSAESPFELTVAPPPPAAAPTPAPSPPPPRPVTRAPAPTATPAATATTAPMPPPARAHLRRAALIVGGAAVAILAAAIGVNVAARNEGDALLRRCAPLCTGNDLGTMRAEQSAAIALYALAGGAAVTSLVLVIVDTTRRKR